jgi:cytochrome c oxidase subunit II
MGFLNKLFGIPPVASEHGEMVDHMLELVHWIMFVLFVGWTLYLAYTLVRFYRKRHPRADYTGLRGHASSHIEIGVIITEVILLLGFAFPLWATQVDQFPDPDVRVNVWGQQFSWNFHYPGADKKFGTTNRFLISSDNPIGIDAEDPNSHDDFVTPDLVLPKGKKVELALTSKDVIHNLALVGMRASTDADPAKINRIWFIPILSGKSEIICGQLCGPSHGNMKAQLEVKETQVAFDEWQKQQEPVRDKAFAAEALKRLGIVSPAPAPAPATPAATPAPATTTPAAPAAARAVPATTPSPSPAPASPAEAPPSATPAPAAEGAVVKLRLGVIPNVMKFDKTELTAKAGKKVNLLFENKGCVLQHNFLLLKPGTKDAVGALADKMLTDPAGLAKQYVPETTDVLVKGNKLIGIGQSDLIEFTAPAAAGDYPYICTFPGHWRLMHGVLKVTP